MEITRTYDVPPSGFEVESAMLHVPSEPLIGTEPIHSGGMKEKLDSMKRVGLDRLHRLQTTIADHTSSIRRSGMRKWSDASRTMSDRASTIRGSVTTKINDLKPVVRERAVQLKSDMRENAGKWAGIAAGAGLVLGIGGRIMRHRMHHRHMPQLVIIESTC